MFFRFPPMGKFKKTRFERSWTTFVNPAFSAAWKSPPKMVAWNRNCKIRSQGCFFASPRWGKLKKRVLNGIPRPSLPQRFGLFGKAHPKWWHETEILKYDPTAVFFCLAKMGKVEKTRFERNWTTFVNSAFSAAWKSPPKMVASNRNFKIRSQGCFFVSPRWGNLTKRVLNAIGPLSWTRLFPLLGKAHPKWWHETEIVKFDPKAVFSLRPDRESWKNAFWTEFDDLRYPSVLRCLEKPTQNGGMKPKF